MTEKQKIFADEYLIDLNATRAYRAAYPNCKKNSSADAAARKLLGNTRIQQYINERLEELQSKRVANVQEVMEHLTAVLRGEIREETVVVEGIGDGCSEARIVEKQVGARDRLKAAELLGKRYSLFTEKVEVSGLDDEKAKLDDILQQMRGGG
ncbi:terminase small subunit [Hominiventricola aquisgranensis]|uniref:Terminase small subunit n=1 Tax=Hominiventricola aquisgranensis TaxID=3133164 RepID=A0ABV1HZK0_9FIRM